MTSRPWFRRFVVLALTMPTIASTLGVNGGAVFQILAVENLGLSPAAIGTALGLGVVSIPVQLWAARMSLGVARRNLLLFLVSMALGCWILAGLIATTDGGAPAYVALVLTVLAEVAVSVLYATSWQPLLSTVLGSVQRQQLNSRARAAGGLVLVGVLLVFGSADRGLRVGILLAAGAAALGVVWLLRRLPAPDPDEHDDGTGAAGDASLPARVVPLFVLGGFAAASIWPIFPVYTAEVLWPTADLGVVGAIATAGGLGVDALWRATDTALLPRARVAAGFLVGAAVLFLALPGTDRAGAVDVAVLVAYGIAVAARAVLLLSVLELAHRLSTPRTTVRVLTVFDVVVSTALQASLFLGGILTTWAVGTTWGPTDPYQAWVLLLALGVVVGVRWTGRTAGVDTLG